PAAYCDVFASVRELAENPHTLLQGLALLVAGLDREPSRVLTVGIIRAADEAAVAAQFQTEPAIAAGRAGAWVGPVLARRDEMGPQVLVGGGDDFADFEVLGWTAGVGDPPPECPHHRPPLDGAAGDVVQLLLHRGGEAGIDIMLEEADQERGNQPPA